MHLVSPAVGDTRGSSRKCSRVTKKKRCNPYTILGDAVGVTPTLLVSRATRLVSPTVTLTYPLFCVDAISCQAILISVPFSKCQFCSFWPRAACAGRYISPTQGPAHLENQSYCFWGSRPLFLFFIHFVYNQYLWMTHHYRR
mgnify:CR=1 FL=1